MNYCTYCNSYFPENILDHIASKTHKENVIKSRKIISTFQEYKEYMEKRLIPEEEYEVILKLGKLEQSDSDSKKLEDYLSNRRNSLGGEKDEKYRRSEVKAFS